MEGKLTVADTGIHQFSARFGSDSSNYYVISDSTQNDCTVFQAGWNHIRLDFSTRTRVGTPVDTAMRYAALYWSRDTTTAALLHLNDTDWGFDNLRLKSGKYYLLSYYSRFVWQDTAFGVSENSSNDSHAIMVQNDELEVIMDKIAELASNFLRDSSDEAKYAKSYENRRRSYLMNNPSRASVLTTSYYQFGSLQDKPTFNDS